MGAPPDDETNQYAASNTEGDGDVAESPDDSPSTDQEALEESEQGLPVGEGEVAVTEGSSKELPLEDDHITPPEALTQTETAEVDQHFVADDDGSTSVISDSDTEDGDEGMVDSIMHIERSMIGSVANTLMACRNVLHDAGGEYEELEGMVTASLELLEVCTTCGAVDPTDNLSCSNGFHQKAYDPPDAEEVFEEPDAFIEDLKAQVVEDEGEEPKSVPEYADGIASPWPASTGTHQHEKHTLGG